MNNLYAATENTTPATSMGTLDLILGASFEVQLIILILIIFSVFSWAIIAFKWKSFKICYRNTENFLDFFWSGKSMDHIYTEAKKHSSSSVAKVFQAGYVELQRLMEKERQRKTPSEKNRDPARIIPPESSITNLERSLSKASRNELLKLESSLSFLATAGSTAPFIGLLGTVLGIVNAFRSIGEQGGASLSVVAPGIAEALIATAIGLFCAIPATMGYNFYIQKLRLLKAQMESFAEDFLNIVKRNFLAS